MPYSESDNKPERRYRSAISGRFVSAWYAITHPKTTVQEIVRKVRGR